MKKTHKKRTKYEMIETKFGKLKSQWRKSKIKKTYHVKCLRIWSNWHSYTLLVELYNGITTSENSLAISLKVKHTYHVTQPFWEARWNLSPSHSYRGRESSLCPVYPHDSHYLPIDHLVATSVFRSTVVVLQSLY